MCLYYNPVSTGDIKITSVKPYGVTGEDLDTKGQHSVSFTLNGREYSHTFLICSLATDAAGLRGTDFFGEKQVPRLT